MVVFFILHIITVNKTANTRGTSISRHTVKIMMKRDPDNSLYPPMLSMICLFRYCSMKYLASLLFTRIIARENEKANSTQKFINKIFAIPSSLFIIEIHGIINVNNETGPLTRKARKALKPDNNP